MATPPGRESPVSAGVVAMPDASAGGPGLTMDGKPIWSGITMSLPYRILFHHVSRLVATGHARRLEPADLYPAKDLEMDKARARVRGRGGREGAVGLCRACFLGVSL
jgi:hypothetical protein